MSQTLITATTCDSLDRLTDFMRQSSVRSVGRIDVVDQRGEPLKLRLVRDEFGGHRVEVVGPFPGA